MEWLLLIALGGLCFWAFNYFTNNGKTTKVSLSQPVIDLAGIELSPEQKYLFNLLETTNNNLFITGKAGTGKSILLQYFKQNSKKRMVVVAPTGVAALNVGGQTIHSLFRIPPGFVNKDKLHPNYKTSELLQHIDVVVIDEISMVRADLMDAVDIVLRMGRRNSLPFGGVQIVLFGDVFQLPPVVEDRELQKYFFDNLNGYYFFNAEVWQKTKLELYELTNIFRQKDEVFKSILNSIREGNFSEDQLRLLNKRADVRIPPEGIVTLATTNQSVNEINQYRLSQLPSKEYEYHALVYGDLDPSYFPTEKILKLKVGAQVIFLKNDRNKRWVNGTIGYVQKLEQNEIKVSINNISYPVLPETWKKIRYTYNRYSKKIEEEVTSSFTQYPLRLAWAMTIHKAQGHTYGSVVVDMGAGAFAFGQTYVALSRCESLEGLYLKRQVLLEDIKVDPDVIKFMRSSKILEIPTNI